MRALEWLAALEARAAELESTIAEVEALLGSGDLNAKQTRKRNSGSPTCRIA